MRISLVSLAFESTVGIIYLAVHAPYLSFFGTKGGEKAAHLVLIVALPFGIATVCLPSEEYNMWRRLHCRQGTVHK